MYPNQHPQQPPPPPQVVYVHQQTSRATTVGVWVLVAWFVGPAVLLLLCCAGLFGLGVIGAVTDVPTPTPAATAGN